VKKLFIVGIAALALAGCDSASQIIDDTVANVQEKVENDLENKAQDLLNDADAVVQEKINSLDTNEQTNDVELQDQP
jgi:outer membrane murein-binding lipoprotein Lpp